MGGNSGGSIYGRFKVALFLSNLYVTLPLPLLRLCIVNTDGAVFTHSLFIGFFARRYAYSDAGLDAAGTTTILLYKLKPRARCGTTFPLPMVDSSALHTLATLIHSLECRTRSTTGDKDGGRGLRLRALWIEPEGRGLGTAWSSPWKAVGGGVGAFWGKGFCCWDGEEGCCPRCGYTRHTFLSCYVFHYPLQCLKQSLIADPCLEAGIAARDVDEHDLVLKLAMMRENIITV
ncbi:unnamed protein product [Prunus armeniaca]|uniref:Uncharacterized protein n=1 Tax=Prunus armeniaca TaxID=36596 RepID=A0A6J5U6P4_PRUAR|nr:unnamed protein product [Prunus armeniaca]